MKTVKIIMVVGMLGAGLVAAALASATASMGSEAQFDVAATYRAKCVACHGPKAEKKFDVTKADADHVQAILKGKKMEKPPHMPGYEDKGVSEDQAKALVTHMKSILQ